MTDEVTTQHTPGPWYLAEDVSGTAFIFCNSNYRHKYIDNEQERHANLKLAESAPMLKASHDRLLAACRLAEDRLSMVDHRDDCRQSVNDAIAQAEALDK